MTSSLAPMLMLLRKIKTALLIIASCKNWFPIFLFKAGLRDALQTVFLRNGLVLSVPIQKNAWGAVLEPAMADVYGIRRACPDVIVDVGAHIGGFTCLAAMTHKNAVVHAFEPQEDIALVLRENAERNNLNNVVVHHDVVTADGRTVTFYNSTNRGASGLFDLGSKGNVSLPSITLGDLSLKKHHSLFLKLDCEGSEGELIEWVLLNRDELPEAIDIACEWHPWCPTSLEAALCRMQREGFEAYTLERFGEKYLMARRTADNFRERAICQWNLSTHRRKYTNIFCC